VADPLRFEIGQRMHLTDVYARTLIRGDSESQEAELLLLRLGAAQTLHKNFYEELMSEDEVRESIANASELVTALRRLAGDARQPSMQPGANSANRWRSVQQL